MKTQQTLSDISTLLQYIRSVLDSQKENPHEEQLESMGQVTLKIITTLRDLSNLITHDNRDMILNYTETVQSESDKFKESLENIASLLHSHNTSQTEIHELLDKAYEDYFEAVHTTSSQLKENHLQNHESFKDVTNTIESLQEVMSSIDNKILSQADLEDILSGISTRFEEIMSGDDAFNKSSGHALEVIGNQLDTTNDILASVSESLESIQESFIESTSRLSLVDVKSDNIINILTEGKYNAK